MKWDDLRIVLAVARAGTLSKAASRLRIDQSTVSRRLNAIEQDIGEPLFFRHSSGFVPTEIGENVIAEVEEMERAVARLEDTTRQGRNGLKGQVRIATMPWILEHIIAPKLPDLWNTHPDIEIHGIADLHERVSSRRETELSLRFELPAKAGEQEIAIAQIPYSVYASSESDPADLAWAGSLVQIEKLAPQSWLDQHLDGTGEAALFRSDDAGVIYAAVRSGGLKALLPDILAGRDPKLRKLDRYGDGLVRTLKLQVHPDIAELARVEAVIGWLKEAFTNRN